MTLCRHSQETARIALSNKAVDKEALNKMANEAIELWSNKKFDQAEPLFRQTLPYVDDNHWSSTDYLGYFASNQSALGKIDEATVLLKRSLQSALATDSEESITVTVARLCLADHLLLQGEIDSALTTIQPSLDIDCEGKRPLVLLFARIQFEKGNSDAVELAAREVLQLKPDGKFKTLEDVLERIRNWR